MPPTSSPDYVRGRAEALLQVAAQLRGYSTAPRPPTSWWPCDRYRAAGRAEVLDLLLGFAGQLEQDARRLQPKPAPCPCKGGWLRLALGALGVKP